MQNMKIPTYSSAVASPKIFWEAKCLTSGEQQYFSLGHLFSKHKMSRHAKNLGVMAPWVTPGYAYDVVFHVVENLQSLKAFLDRQTTLFAMKTKSRCRKMT